MLEIFLEASESRKGMKIGVFIGRVNPTKHFNPQSVIILVIDASSQSLHLTQYLLRAYLFTPNALCLNFEANTDTTTKGRLR